METKNKGTLSWNMQEKFATKMKNPQRTQMSEVSE